MDDLQNHDLHMIICRYIYDNNISFPLYPKIVILIDFFVILEKNIYKCITICVTMVITDFGGSLSWNGL